MRILRFLVLSMVILSLVGCASAPKKESVQVTIKPKGIHEDCVVVTPKEVLSFKFVSSAPTDFNLHHHDGDKIFYPIEKKGATSFEGTFIPEKEEVYCLMWTNTSSVPVALTSEYQTMMKPAK